MAPSQTMSQTKRVGRQGDVGSRSITSRDAGHALIIPILLAALWSPAICAAQKPARLIKVEVTGNIRVTQEQIIETSQLKIGQTVDPAVLDAAAVRLVQSGLFKTLSYRLRTADD